MVIKVGDRVKVIASSIYTEQEVVDQGLAEQLLFGKTGTVTDIVPVFVWPIQVRLDETSKFGWFTEVELEVFDDED